MNEVRPSVGRERRTLWRDADFLRFWFATTISVFGSRITGLALYYYYEC